MIILINLNFHHNFTEESPPASFWLTFVGLCFAFCKQKISFNFNNLRKD